MTNQRFEELIVTQELRLCGRRIYATRTCGLDKPPPVAGQACLPVRPEVVPEVVSEGDSPVATCAYGAQMCPSG